MATGKKTGGRQKGSLNKRTLERIAAERQAAVASAAGSAARGQKTGGRQRGTPNKATVERKEQLSDAVASALAGLSSKAIDEMTPRDVMRLVMTLGLKAGDLKTAYMAATDLAPYMHAKLTAVAPLPPAELDPATMTDAQIITRLAAFEAIGKRKPARVVH